MDSNNNEIIHEFPPFFKVFKDGSIERYMPLHGPVPAGLDPTTGVQSKDAVVSLETGVKARIFIPKINDGSPKLPLLVHYHGGGFCMGSPFGEIGKKFLTSLVLKANVLVVCVDYRLAPEHRLPIAYDDSSAALQWIASHSNGQGPEAWLNEYADLDRVFLGGESAGANIAHYVAVQAGVNVPVGLKIVGLVMVHPFFGGKECDEMYKFLSSTSSGCDDDPKLNPAADPDLAKMPCEKVLVCVAERDWLRDRGVSYYETLHKLKGEGFAELFETKGEDHCFHLFNPNGEDNSDKAGLLQQKVFKDGSIERYKPVIPPLPEHVPAGLDPTTGVQSKDVVVSPETGVKARIFIPKMNDGGQKLPLLVHYHGGGFCLGSPFGERMGRFLSSLVLKANIIVVSVDYRLAPEHRLPIAYDDSSAALKWIASHSIGQGPEAWLNECADLDMVFLGGESAGANIAHYVAVQAGVNVPVGLNIVGLVMVHPFFGGEGCDKMYKFMSSTSSGCSDDPKLNPAADLDLVKMPCEKVLVCVAEKDYLSARGVSYYETLEKIKGEGFAELFETKGEGHCFYLFNPNGGDSSDKAAHLLQKMVEFLNLS